LKLTSLAVITVLVVLGCGLASAQTFGFTSVGGGLYCNYEVLQNAFGAPFTVWQGTDNLSACGAPLNATIVGIKGGLTKVTNPAGFAASGVTYADNVYDAQSEFYTGAQWDVTSALKCNKVNKKTGAYTGSYSWIGFASVSGFIFGDNYGYLSCSIPAGNAPTKGLSTGKYSKVPARK
jgi:hypothetical protein